MAKMICLTPEAVEWVPKTTVGVRGTGDVLKPSGRRAWVATPTQPRRRHSEPHVSSVAPAETRPSRSRRISSAPAVVVLAPTLPASATAPASEAKAAASRWMLERENAIASAEEILLEERYSSPRVAPAVVDAVRARLREKQRDSEAVTETTDADKVRRLHAHALRATKELQEVRTLVNASLAEEALIAQVTPRARQRTLFAGLKSSTWVPVRESDELKKRAVEEVPVDMQGPTASGDVEPHATGACEASEGWAC